VPTVEELNQRHPSCDRELIEDLDALYAGDKKLEARLTRFLPQREREKPERYALRKREAQYRNYLGPIIDYFTSMLFVSKPVLKAKAAGAKDATADPGEYWSKLREDCDGGGTDIDSLYKATLTRAMVERTGWLRLHQPTDGGPISGTAADFERRKLGECWIEHVDGEAVLDWELDDSGRLLFAVTHKLEARRTSVSSKRDQVVETWQWLTPSAVETFQLSYPKDKPPESTTEVPSLGSVPHTFGAVPLVCLDLPPALWVANRLRSPQLAHFRKLNAQSWSLSCTAYAMPVAKVRDPAAFAEAAQGAGYGIVIGTEEDWSWEAPPNGHFAALDTEIKAEKDELFRIANQMALGVENNAAAIGRSAESKASDAESTRVVLTAFSRKVKETIEFTLELISRARGEKLKWSVEGLDDFAALDLTAFLEQLTLAKGAGGIPSRTFEIQSKTRLAEALLPDLDEEVKATIRQEIKDGAVDPVEQRDLEQAAALAVFADPPSAERPGDDPEKPKDRPARGRGRPKNGQVNDRSGAPA
jgi:hypothetical protein